MTPEPRDKVIVVGASTAGLFTAYRLAQAGVPVRVFEAQPRLDPDPRILIVTPTWLRLLDFDVSEAVLNRTHTFELISRRASARIELREPDVVVERARFLKLLARQVEQAGGELLLDHRFEALRQRRDFPLVTFRNAHGPEEMRADTVIGADGVDSTVAAEVAAPAARENGGQAQTPGHQPLLDRLAERLVHRPHQSPADARSAGRRTEGEAAAAAGPRVAIDGAQTALSPTVSSAAADHQPGRVGIVQARVALPDDLPPDTVRCWFDRRTTRFFYWLIPESAHTGALGLVAESEAQAERALDRFLAARDLEPIEHQRAPVAMYPPALRPRARLGQGRALLVGDAAGQVKGTTVGGVVMGMRGAAAAARAIVRGTSYGAEARALHCELRLHAAGRGLLDGFRDADYDRLLHLLNGPARRVLRRYNRDELRRAHWRLFLAQPRWLILAARAFLQTVTNG